MGSKVVGDSIDACRIALRFGAEYLSFVLVVEVSDFRSDVS